MRVSILAHVFFVVSAFFVMPVFASTFAAGSLQFSPTSKAVKVGDTFDVQVNINTGSDSVAGADAYIIYDPSIVDYQSVTNGTFFDTPFKATYPPNKVYLGGIMDQGSLKPDSGSGSMATITFKAKQNGTMTLTFACGSSAAPQTSAISKKNSGGQNIIDCNSNGTSTITVSGSGGSSPTATPTPSSGGSGAAAATPTPGSSAATAGTATPTPVTKLPRSGVAENMMAYGIMGGLLLILGFGARLLL